MEYSTQVILSWSRRLGGEHALEWALQSVCLLVFRHLTFLQDLLLRHEPFQRLLLLAFRRRHAATLAGAIKPPPVAGFDQLDYYVDAQSRQLLEFAALHALSTHLADGDVLAPAKLLPQVSRVLLQTEEREAGKMLEAVAGALAAQMNAGLLFVDAMLLATLAGDALGEVPEAFLSAFSGSSSGGGMASDSLAAAELQLAWKALRGVLSALERPTVVFIRSAEVLLCSSSEAHEAFQAAFGSDQALELELKGGAASGAPVVIMGGMSVDESAAARAGVRPERHRPFGLGGGGSGGVGGFDGDEDEDGKKAGGAKAGGFSALGSGLDDLDDDLGLGLLFSLSKSVSDSLRPNPRKLLLKVFPTRIKLQPPPAGPAGLRHVQRLQQDAAEVAEEENYRVASAVAASAGVALPPKSSGLYTRVAGGSKALSRQDWRKAISWAVSIETLQAKQRQLAEEQAAEEVEEAAAREALRQHAEAAGAGEDALAEAGMDTHAGDKHSMQQSLLGAPDLPGPGTPASSTGIRQRRRGGDSGDSGCSGGPAERMNTAAGRSRPTLRQRQRQRPRGSGHLPSPQAVAAQIWRACNPLRMAAAAAALPGRALYAGVTAAAWALSWLPVVGDWFETALLKAQIDAELRELEEEMRRDLAELEQATTAAAAAAAAALGGEGSARLPATSSADSEISLPLEAYCGAGGSSSSGALRLSEAALRYGLSMLQRSSGGPKQAIEPSNRYEKQLLPEVLSPEDCGRGFSEVGALQDAKSALREAVQLPLQHPEFFAGGTLARPSKGVLLFGPPGTGKTLVARAAAAECGAAFLPLNMSSVTNKFFGESNKLLRAAFTLASKMAPCVIFIDEVDALLGKRDSEMEYAPRREMKTEMMALWDGIRPGKERVMVLGATNRPFDLDEAVLRRFTHRIFVGLPDRADRAAILRVVLEGERLAADVSIDRLAELTAGFSGSDLRQLCVQAAMRPVRNFLEHSSSVARHAQAEEEAAAVAGPRAMPGAGPDASRVQEQRQAAAEAPGSSSRRRVTGGSGPEGQAPVSSSDRAGGDEQQLGSPPAGALEAAPRGQHRPAETAAPGAAAAAEAEETAEAEAEAEEAAAAEAEAKAEQEAEAEEAAGAAGVPAPLSGGPASVASAASASAVSAASSLRLVPHLDSLLRQAERLASPPANPKTDLRPIGMKDFEEALKEVGPSVNPDSSTIQQLNEWNTQFGTTGSKAGVQAKQLSYYS